MSKEKLSIEYIEEVVEDFNEQKEIFVNVPTKNGIEKVGLTINKYFNPTKIKLCIKELMSNLDTFKTYLKDYNNAEDLFQCWLILLMIKHFTSLEIPNDFKKQLAIFDKLVETTVLFQIFANFNTNEVEKVMVHLNEITLDFMFKMDEYSDLFEKLEKEDKLSKEKIRQIIEGK